MNSNQILFIFIALLVLSSQGEDVFKNTNYNIEVSQQIATAFLAMDTDYGDFFPEDSPNVFLKPQMGKNCVPCKFGYQSCCAPSICVKKILLPDECQDFKKGE
jgi:hypothetical protein